MGYARALLAKDVKGERESLQKKAGKKSLWGSIGRTIGGLGAMAITGGTVNPLTLGLLSGGGSFLGGAIGSAGAGKLTGGKFFQSEREELQSELGAFGAENITQSLEAGIKAGIGQKYKLMKSGKDAAKLSEGFGMDFKGSMAGKGLQKVKTARLGREYAEKGWIDPKLQTEIGGEPIVALDRRNQLSFAPSIDESAIGATTSKSTFVEPGLGSRTGEYASTDLSFRPSDEIITKKPNYKVMDALQEFLDPVHTAGDKDLGGRPFWDQVSSTEELVGQFKGISKNPWGTR